MTFDFWSVVNSTEFQNEAAVENESHGGCFKNFEEPGEYDLTIKAAEMRQTKAGAPKLTLRVLADSGESGFWDLLVGHGGGVSKAAKIAQQNLAMILKYSGAKAANPSALIGLRVKAWVKIEKGNYDIERPVFRPIGVASGARQAAPVSRPAPAAKPAAKPAPQPQPDANDMDDDDIPF
jgi:hypothetical protein|nr:MAG TPA: Protein of unknown function (DUF669) [Caudoviricetes sp.]